MQNLNVKENRINPNTRIISFIISKLGISFVYVEVGIIEVPQKYLIISSKIKSNGINRR